MFGLWDGEKEGRKSGSRRSTLQSHLYGCRERCCSSGQYCNALSDPDAFDSGGTLATTRLGHRRFICRITELDGFSSLAHRDVHRYRK